MPRLGETLDTFKRLRRVAASSFGDNQRLAQREFAPNPGALRMLFSVPRDLPENAALVVVLHGCTQSAEGYAAGAGWLDLAERFGFAILCPEQSTANNPNRCFNWFEPRDTTRGSGEAASIAVMIREMLADHPIDPGKVFITGLSAGGAMTASMAAAYPDLFAGAAIIAGLPHGAAASMGEAFRAMSAPASLTPKAWGDRVRRASSTGAAWPPISIWHGGADSTVLPQAADALISQWTDVHGVAGPSTPARTPDNRRFEVWRTHEGRVVVEHHRFPGMGHGAPVKAGGGVNGTAGPFILDVGTASSLEIAMGWGIVDAPFATSMAPPRPGSSTGPELWEASRFEGCDPAPEGSASITDTIEKALRVAGLLE